MKKTKMYDAGGGILYVMFLGFSGFCVIVLAAVVIFILVKTVQQIIQYRKKEIEESQDD